MKFSGGVAGLLTKKNNGLDFGSDLLSNLDPGILFLFAYLQYVK